MSDKLPAIDARQLLSALRKIGYTQVRQRGSHVQIMRTKADGTVSEFPVPLHSGRILKKGLLRGIIRLAGLSVEDFKNLL